MSAAVAGGAARLLPAVPSAEGYTAHLATAGPLPAFSGDELIAELGRAGLTGHGGAAFPAALKWQAVAERSRARGAVVVGDAMETEPASLKDRTLLALRPHLVFDGMLLAASAMRARRVVLCVASSSDALARTLVAALAERRRAAPHEPRIELVTSPSRYIAGEETALISRLNGRRALPRAVPPRPFATGVDGLPTLVNNVETFAHAALIARRGARWFRSVGSAAAPGTTLLSVCGGVAAPGVKEMAYDSTIGQVVAAAGGPAGDPVAVLVGGYFGRWAPAATAWSLTLEPGSLRRAGLALGAGVIAVLPRDACGVAETDRILAFMARESSGQCGPCSRGLPALAALFHDTALGRARPGVLETCARWSLEIRGRGACRHPDGATLMAASALEVFHDELRRHLRHGPCRESARPPLLPTPVLTG
ncbi:MAG: proton-conducting membrane transporter, partial [Candidatus Dormibacteraeota bacterium]|nr:proton-conducting membrane transporter [Candidatus Dormibacteraeota bacterium]